MKPYAEPLHLTSPHVRGQRVKDAQYLLQHNRFGIRFYTGPVDGDFGEETAKGANLARKLLGYPKHRVATNTYGQELHEYLLGPRRHGRRLRPAMIRRRKKTLREYAKSNTIKAQALRIAREQIGVKESPFASNRQRYGVWYGLNGVPWCAIGVTYCFVTAGDTRTFKRGERSAWALWPLNMARAGAYGLSVTNNPEPGDIVVYTHGQGHIGIFDKWLDRPNGVFQTVEFNTSETNNANGGEVQDRRRRVGDSMQPHFVRYAT